MAEKSIKELFTLWNDEKEHYKHTEVGSGVQKFVKKIFKCHELFGLKEGKLSTAGLDRANEFIEEAKKKGRKADVIIFVDSDVIVPVEIEKFGHIKSGERQLFQYQTDWIKKYGLLTDGNEWRFYNNQYIERSFKLKNIFENPSEFLTFWREYTKPDYYYRSFFEKKGQLEIFVKPAPHLDEAREDFFADITTLIENFENKLNLKGYFKDEHGELAKKKKAVEITYAYLIQFILYKVLVDNAFDDFEDDWKYRLQSIDKAIKSESYAEVLTRIKGISDKISLKVYRRFNDEQLMINESLKEILSHPKTDIGDVSVWLDILLFINRYNFANVQNEIFGYVYENYLKDLYSEGHKGQYFTDPAVVNFMLQQAGYTKKEIKQRLSNNKNSISLIDPSCGSGTFLYSATSAIIDAVPNGSQQSSKIIEELVNNNLFGLDIEEFPLYLAEMNIIMRLLPLIINEKYNNPLDKKIKVFKTKDSISEFLDTALRNTASDVNIKTHKDNRQVQLFAEELNLGYSSYVRDEDDLKELKNSLETSPPTIQRFRFDFVIGNPPYISYNECAKQSVHIFHLMKDGKAKLNDIYGVNLHSTPTHPKRYRPNPNLYSFFIALGLALLKEQGKLCYILPQTFLINPDYDVLRYHLSKFVTIEKLIIFSGKMFVGRGLRQNRPITTSSLILILKRQAPTEEHKAEIVYYKNEEDDIETCLQNILEQKGIAKNNVSQSLMLNNISNWNFLRQDKRDISFYEAYKSQNSDISIYYEHNLAEKQFKSRFYFDGGYDIDERRAIEKQSNHDDYEVLRFPEKGFTVKRNVGYWPNERSPKDGHFIQLRQANQGYHLLDSKYKIVWPYLRDIRFVFSEKRLIWSRRTTNTFYGIGSDNKRELYYLLSLLNSSVTKKIISFFKLPNESKREIMVSSALIKTEIKVPIISKENAAIKEEIINQTEIMLSMEDIRLADLVDFSGLMVQKFNHISCDGKHLILVKDEKEHRCKIMNNAQLVERFIDEKLFDSDLFNMDKFSLSEIKLLSVCDYRKQCMIKDYIDDLVFSLYFNIQLEDLGFENAGQIRALCSANKYYDISNDNVR